LKRQKRGIAVFPDMKRMKVPQKPAM